MEFSKSILNKSQFNTSKKQANIEQQFKEYKKNVQQFKKSVEEEIDRLIETHIKQIKKLTEEIQNKNKIINQYEKVFGKLTSVDISSTINHNQYTYKKNTSSFYKEDSKDDMKLTKNQTPKQKSKEDQIKEKQIDSFMQADNELFIPPDEMYRSRFEQNSKLKRSFNRQLYQSIKQKKNFIEQNTTKVLQFIAPNSNLNNNKVSLTDVKTTNINNQNQEKNSQSQNQPLNSSLSYMYESIDGLSKSKSKSKNSKKKLKTQNLIKPKQNPETTQKKKQSNRQLQTVLKNMRQKINAKIQHPKVEEIKQSKLLSTGEGLNKGTKVLINPVPIDLTKKNYDGNRGRSTSPPKAYTSILKKSATNDSKLNNTIQGLSAISFYTRESQNQTRFF